MGKGWKHGAAKGAGIGGPAKGGGDKPAVAFTVDSPGRVLAADLNHDPATQEYRAQQVRLNRERRERAWAKLDALIAAESEAVQLNAANSILDRLDGKPGQTVDLRHHTPVTRADDSALLAIATAGGGVVTAPADDTEQPGGLVH